MSEELDNSFNDDSGLGPVTPARAAKAHLILVGFVLAALVVWLLSGIYQVKADQVAIVERFGQYISDGEGKAIRIEHGLHYHLPWPIDKVHIISTQQTRTMLVNAFNVPPTQYEDFKRERLRRGERPEVLSALFDPYLITADKSVLHLEIRLVYRVNDPEAWLNTISHSADIAADSEDDNRNAVLQQIAQHAMITQLSQLEMNDVMFKRREELPVSLLNILQDSMLLSDPSDPTGKRRIGMGIELQKVEITIVRPPDAVKGAFDQVLQALSRRDTEIGKAEADASAAKTAAQARKTNLDLEARSYQTKVVEAARGDALRFTEILKQYAISPDQTRWNLFTEAVNTIAGNARRMIFAQPGKHTIITVDPPQFDAGQTTTRPGG